MRFQEIALPSLLFGATALAAQVNERFVEQSGLSLIKRQQFVPTTTTAEGTTCQDAFGAGYETCREAVGSTNRLCYNPSIGQTCCNGQWACPTGAFCLVNGSCCPNSTDPSSCAAAIGITVSSNFHIPTTGPVPNDNTTANNIKVTPTPATTSPTSTPNSGSWNSGANALGLAGLVFGAVALL